MEDQSVTRYLSCAERVAGQMASRAADVRKMLDVQSGNTEPDDDVTEDSLYDFGLEVTRKVTLKFLMSTGGPADWLEILCDEENAPSSRQGTAPLLVERVTYHFADWFDHAELDVPEGSPLYELAEWIAEAQS